MSEKLVGRARPREGSLRCPYCRDEVVDDSPECPRCQVHVHPECLYELTSCPTLACPVLPRDFQAEGAPLDLRQTPQASALLSPALLALRRTFLLPLVLALVVCLPALVSSERLRMSDMLRSVVLGLPLALATFPTAWAELWSARRQPGRWSQPLLSLASAVTGAAGCVGGMLGSIVMHHYRSYRPTVWSSLQEGMHMVRGNEAGFRDIVVVAFVQFGLLTWLRLRGVRLRFQLLLMGAVSWPLITVLKWLAHTPGLDMFDASREQKQFTAVTVITLGMAMALPLISWLSEAIRWPAWFPWLASPPARRGGKGE